MQLYSWYKEIIPDFERLQQLSGWSCQLFISA